MKKLIKNCNIVNHDSITLGNILIDGDTIIDISKECCDADEVYDAQNRFVVPGLIDMHVHFRDPGLEYKEDIISGSQAAVAGGVTTCLPMANTKPVNDNAIITKYMVDKGKSLSLTDICPVGAITKKLQGEELSEMGEMLDAGAVAFSDDGMPVMNSEVFRRAAEYVRGLGSIILSHAEDKDLAGKGVINEGKISAITGLKGIPAEAEEIMTARDILISKLTKAKIHICHVSTEYSVKLIRRAKEDGINITCEAAPHHFTFTDEKLLSYDTNYKMNPPLRSEKDLAAIIEGLKDGTIDVIATDHAPHHRDEKFVEFDNASFGIIGLQTLLPLSLNLVRKGIINIMKLAELTSYKPSKILNFNNKGIIAKGKLADIVILDTDKQYIFDSTINKSKSSNTPLMNCNLQGIALMTFKNGNLVYSFK